MTSAPSSSTALVVRPADHGTRTRAILFVVLAACVVAASWFRPGTSDTATIDTAAEPQETAQVEPVVFLSEEPSPGAIEVTTTLGADRSSPRREAEPFVSPPAPTFVTDVEVSGVCETADLVAAAVKSPQPQAWRTDSFDTLDPAWQVLAGSWTVESGRFVQLEPAGYDLIAELAVATPAEFSVTVTLQSIDGPLGGGIMISQPTPMTRAGSFIVDFTEGGSFLRWGGYDADSGRYSYLGGAATPAGFDPLAPHQLTVEQSSGRTRVLVDGTEFGQFGALSPGRVGLVTSLSAVSFDDFIITDLAAENA